MTKPMKWVIVLGIAFGALVVVAQQQFNGGVTLVGPLPAGTNVLGHIIADSGSTTAVTTLPALATGSNVIGHVIADSGSTTAVTSLPAFAAGTNKIGITYPWTTCGTTSFETGSPAGLAAMPTSSTAVATATTCVLSIHVTNTTAVATTITLTDNAGTPIQDWNAITVLAGETRDRTYPSGVKFNAGIKVVAGAAGVNYYINGLQ